MKISKFRHIRIKLGYTQSDLGMVLGVTKRTISRYENGDYDIPVAIANLMTCEDIRVRDRIVGDHGYLSLPIIINSFNFVKIVNVKVANTKMIALIAAEFSGQGALHVKVFHQGDDIESIGKFIDSDCRYEIKDRQSLSDDVIKEVISLAFGDKVCIQVEGIGFNYSIDTEE